MTMTKLLRAQWDRVAAIVALLVALIVLLVGYLGVSGTEFVAEQLPYVVSGGLVGLALVVTSATLWISADLRDEWRKLDVLDARLERALGTASAAPLVVADAAPIPLPTVKALRTPRKPARRPATIGTD